MKRLSAKPTSRLRTRTVETTGHKRLAIGQKSSNGATPVGLFCMCLCLGIFACHAAIAGPFFTDDFEDGDLRDGAPAAWIDGTGGQKPASVDNSGGNLSLTKRGNDQGPAGLVKVASTFADAIFRTQFRFTRSEDPNGDHVVITARGSEKDCGLRFCGSYWAAINPDGRLAAGTYNSKTGETIADGWVQTGRRSFDRDVVLELALEGNNISTTAWYADQRKPTRPQYTFTDSRFASGDVGLGEKVYVGTAAAEFRYFQAMPVLAGDFSGNGVLDVADIDILNQEIATATNDLSHDLTADGLVNSDDRYHWVKNVQSTWYGDANLDGQFNSGDLVEVFKANQYEDGVSANSTWATGDWNGDSEFDTGDLVAAFQDGGFEAGSRTAVAAVPEPSATVLASLSLLVFCRLRKTM
jgi:hypothetical protein